MNKRIDPAWQEVLVAIVVVLFLTVIAGGMIGCQVEHAFYPGHGPNNFSFGENVYYLDEPMPCYNTKLERYNASVVIAKEFRQIPDSHFYVWDLQECERNEPFQGGLTRFFMDKYPVQISYLGWNPSLGVPTDAAKVALHEMRHQLGERHCVGDGVKPCIEVFEL